MAANLSSLLSSSRQLTSQLNKPDLPTVNLSLDQIEAESRRLLRQPGSSAEADRANFLLAQANVNASALQDSIAHLNANQTFTPLHALQDTDVAGYLRQAHEQNLISTIEEARTNTQASFYRMLEERQYKDWEEKKKRVFEELGGRSTAGAPAFERSMLESMKKSISGKGSLNASTSHAPPSLLVQTKMMAYDRVITELNNSRLRNQSFPLLHALMEVARESANSDIKSQQFYITLHALKNMTQEPPAVPPIEHPSAHVLNTTSTISRKAARVYLSSTYATNTTTPPTTPQERDSMALRIQITTGAREALEEQYYDVLERTIMARPNEARLGGDPSISNKVRAFLAVRYYREGEWADRIELLAGQPVWAKIFFLVRTGYVNDAWLEAEKHRDVIINAGDATFLEHFKTWVESPERRLPATHKQHLQSAYHNHMLHSNSTDPFKLAMYKLVGRLEPGRRSVPMVTTTTEDWMWWQLSMLDEATENNLASFGEILLSFGERHFDGAPNQSDTRRGLWASVLLMTGQFERAVAALWDHHDTEVEGVHLAIALAYHGLLRIPPRAEISDLTPLTLSPSSPPALNLSSIIWRYIRIFMKMDAKEALQYVCCICLSADQVEVGKEQLITAWEMVRRIVVLSNEGPQWEELVGGVRADGSRFTGIIEQAMPLLHLDHVDQYYKEILVPAARASQESDRIPESIKLYNLANQHSTVVAVLASALGNTISMPTLGEKERLIERTAAEVLRHYERMNRATGKERDAVVSLLKVREALEAKAAGRFEVGLEILQSSRLLPTEPSISMITPQAEAFKDLHESLQRNLQVYLPLAMDLLVGLHQKIKSSMMAEAPKKAQLTDIRQRSRALLVFAGMLQYRMSPDVYSYLSRLDVENAL